MDRESELKIIKDIENSFGYEELVKVFKGAEQTPDVVRAAIEKNGLMLEFVKEQSPEICMLAVKEDGGALKFVKEQTPEICLEAVRSDGMALKYVKEQTNDIIEAAISQNEIAKGFIKDVDSNQSEVQKKDFRDIENNDGFASFSKQNFPSDYEDYLRARREADEAFWASIQAVSESNKGNVGSDGIDFSKLEQAERKVNEAAYEIHQAREREKKQQAERMNKGYVSFADLEEAQRKVDEIFLEMYLSENSAHLGDEVSKILNNEELEGNDSVTDATMDQLLKKYIDYARGQGVPEDVIALMCVPNLSLSQMMQIKFGYEDGLSTLEIAQYAKSEIQRSDMVLARYKLLRAREMGIAQALNTIAEPKRKPSLDERIANGTRNVSKKENGKGKNISKDQDLENPAASKKSEAKEEKDGLDRKISDGAKKAKEGLDGQKKESCKQVDKEHCL